MKYRIFILMIVCTALLIAGCSNKDPLSPDSKELSLTEQDAFLAKQGPNIKMTPWEGKEILLEIIDPGEEWVSDGIMYVRDQVKKYRIETNSDLITGFNIVTSSYHFNLTTGNGDYMSKCCHNPDAVNGTWEGRLVAKLEGFIFTGIGGCRGTGELAGKKLTIEIHETPPPYGETPESGFIIERN